MPFRCPRETGPTGQARAIVGRGAKVKPCLRRARKIGMESGMTTPDDKLSREERPLTREERLAAKLRENLRRRKTQAKAMAGKDDAPLPKGESKG